MSLKDPEKRREYNREYRIKNAESLRAKALQRYCDNREAIRAQQRVDYWKNPDRAREKKRLAYVKVYPNGRRADVICQQCGKSFDVANRSLERGAGKFCSRACKYASQIERIECVCLVCKRTFEIWPSGVADGAGKYCSWKCRVEGFRGPGNPHWTGEDRDYRGPDWRKARWAALKRDQFTCQQCGLKDRRRIVVHHIVEWHVTENNSLDNLVTVCRSCHGKIHALGRDFYWSRSDLECATTVRMSKGRVISGRKVVV